MAYSWIGRAALGSFINTRMVLRVIKYGSLVLLTVAFLGMSHDAFSLNPAQQVALPYQYSLVRWEAGNLLSKWVHRLTTALPWNSQSEADRRSDVREYFRLGKEIKRGP